MKKYNNKSNVIGNLIHEYRKNSKFSKKIDLCKQLELHGVYLDITELKRIEEGKMIVKDFELIALCKVLDINYNDLKNTID